MPINSYFTISSITWLPAFDFILLLRSYAALYTGIYAVCICFFMAYHAHTVCAAILTDSSLLAPCSSGGSFWGPKESKDSIIFLMREDESSNYSNTTLLQGVVGTLAPEHAIWQRPQRRGAVWHATAAFTQHAALHSCVFQVPKPPTCPHYWNKQTVRPQKQKGAALGTLPMHKSTW